MRILIIIALFSTFNLSAQNMSETNLPYHEISQSYETYAPGNVIARMIDGLGYRYYWATENLSDQSLSFRPSEDAQDMMETLMHLYGLSETILNTVKGKDNIRPYDIPEMDYETLRRKTLFQLQEASRLFQNLDENELSKMELAFSRGEKRSSFPIWNLINGPIADAIYHTGQVVSFRRTADNPIHSGVNVFTGKTKE